jgi:acyl carrier protein
MSTPELELEIKKLIVESLKLEGTTPESIDSEAPLFVEGLGLDSIDALELAMAVRKRYGIKAQADDSQNRKIYSNVKALAAYVDQERAKGAA